MNIGHTKLHHSVWRGLPLSELGRAKEALSTLWTFAGLQGERRNCGNKEADLQEGGRGQQAGGGGWGWELSS